VVDLFQPINACVAQARLILDIDHTAAGNLRIKLEHCGVEVELWDRSSGGGCDLVGSYLFDDNAPTAYGAAIGSCPSGSLPPGSYRPAQMLSAFDGMSARGNWRLTICDEVSNNVGVLNAAYIDITYRQTNVSDPGLPTSVPAGGNGFNACGSGLSSTVIRTIDFNQSGPIGYVLLDLGLTHPVAADLLITLEHNNIVRTIFDGCGGTANFSGDYSISDFFPSLCNAAVAANVGMGQNIPNTNYSPAETFSAWNNTDMAGLWTLTICDRGASTGSTGQLTNFNIRVARQCPLALSFSQPSGSADLRIFNGSGFPGNRVFNAVATSMGATPNGWFYGLDIAFPDLVVEFAFPGPSPFLGTLDSCGERRFVLPGPIPSGLTFYAVAVELNSQSAIVGSSNPISYVTQ
jgi:subtilisin-like proprotein convertase family protein